MATLINRAQICAAYTSIADSSAGSRAGDWISMANYNHATIIVSVNDDANNQIAFTINQATTNTGASSKTVAFLTDFWRKTHASDITLATTFTHVTQAAAATFNLTAASSNMVVVEIDAEDLDSDGGFDFFSVDQADGTSTNAVLADVIIILTEPRYAQDITVSAIS